MSEQGPRINSSELPLPWLRRDAFIMVVVAIIGAALLVVSAHQLITELARVPARGYYQHHQPRFYQPIVGSDYAREAITRIKRIPPERRGEQEWRRLAELLMMLPLPDSQPETAVQRRDDINAAVQASLAQNPLHPLSWAFLAELQLPPLGDCAQGLPKVQQAYRVAPIDPGVAYYRFELAARCLPDWTPEFAETIRADLQTLILHAPAVRRAGLLDWAAAQPAARELIEQLLADNPDPAALEKFQKELKRHMARAQ